ncbi:hypothetical protein SAMN02910369_00588 [Lachnospiraceae bacterium NE2001]|nr:hypothetical protein SAMN02910369_00588 [Lachnospiraceae bacterium NE2001]
MPNYKNWTEQDEKNATEGFDLERKSESDIAELSFKEFRDMMIEVGWDRDRQTTQFMYSVFELYNDDPLALGDFAGKSAGSFDDMISNVNEIIEQAESENRNEQNEKAYNEVKKWPEYINDLKKADEAERSARIEEENRKKQEEEQLKKEEEERKRQEEERLEKEEEERKKQEEADRKKEAEDRKKQEEQKKQEEDPEIEARRREIEEMFERARIQEEQEKKAKKIAEETEKNKVDNMIATIERNQWLQRKILVGAYERGAKSKGVVEELMYRENDLRESVISKNFIYSGNLDDYEPKDWTKEELDIIEKGIINTVERDEAFKEQKRKEELEAQRLIDEEKKLPRMSQADIDNLRREVTRISEKGIDLNEYIQSQAYKDYAENNGFDSNVEWSPLDIAITSTYGPKATNELKKLNKKQYEDALKHLKAVEKIYDDHEKEQKFSGADMDSFAMARWLGGQGYKNMLNLYGDKKVGDRSMVAYFDDALKNAVQARDKAKGFDTKYIEEAQKLYTENKERFDNILSTMSTMSGNSVAGPEVLQQCKKELTELNADKGMMKKLNQFCHLLYKTKQNDEEVCQLGTDKKPLFVEPYTKGTNLTNGATKAKELDILDTCYNSLLKPAKKAARNSDEYNNILKSVLDLEKIVKKADDPQKIEAEYAKGIKKTLELINKYRLHKAADGIKQDVTLQKLAAVERVDKFLQTRYKNITTNEYLDAGKSVQEKYKVEVPEQYENGDAYVTALAIKKIKNIENHPLDYTEHLEKEVGKKGLDNLGLSSKEKKQLSALTGRLVPEDETKKKTTSNNTEKKTGKVVDPLKK